jgi:hypothetical protein
MRVPSEKQAISQVAKALSEHVIANQAEAVVLIQPRTPQVDAIVKAGRFTFVVEWKGSSNAGTIAHAVDQIVRYARELNQKSIPLIAVPFMGQVGRELCTRAGVSWLDLSGNAMIIAPGLRIIVDGRPNRFIRRGRPSTAFAPKSSRIARWLLLHPDHSFTQREISRATELGEGFTSRIVAKLLADGLIVRNQDGAVRPRDPDLLLDAWYEEYDFEKHNIIRGHLAVRSGDAVVRQVADALAGASIQYAVTGLAASWILDRFTGFRIASVYLAAEPPRELLDVLSFREDERGANTWMVIPNDLGVFHGSSVHENVWCVHPVQAYLDLKGHPERSREAAKNLRAEHLNWRKNAG